MNFEDLIELEEQYLLHRKNLLKSLLDEIKYKELKLEDLEASYQKKLADLKQENQKLKNNIVMLEAQLKNEKLEQRELEEYNELIERSMQAYMKKRDIVLKRACKELVAYKKFFRKYMNRQDFYTLLFINFIRGDEKEFYKAYKDIFQDKYLEEKELYSTLDNIREKKWVVGSLERIDERMKLVNINSYVKAQLLHDMNAYMEKELKDGCNKGNASIVEQKMEMMPLEELMQQIEENFIIEKRQYVINLLEYTCEHAAYYNTLWENRMIHRLLCISYFYNYDKKLIQSYSSIRKYLSVETEGNKLYRLLCQDREKKTYDTVTICASRYIETSQNIYGFEGKEAKGLRRKIKKLCIPYRKNIFQKGSCCSGQTTMQEVWIIMRDSAGAVRVGAKYCNKCSKLYLEQDEIAHINKLIVPNKIEIKKEEKANTKTVTNKNEQNISGFIIKEINDYFSMMPQHTSSELNIKLNKTSPLMEMGYTTSKSEQERWRILTQHAMPTLGKEKTKNYLKLFIKMHGAKANMKNAVAVWQKDLSKIETYF